MPLVKNWKILFFFLHVEKYLEINPPTCHVSFCDVAYCDVIVT